MADKEEEKIHLRLKQLREKLKMTQNEFATKAGFSSQSNYSAVESGRKSIGDRLLKDISIALNVSLTWLKYGEGEMFNPLMNEAKQLGSNTSKEKIIRNGNEFTDMGHGQYSMLVPLVEEYAYAGFLSGYADKEYINELPHHSIIVRQIHGGKYLSFRAVGDSMNDNSGDAIAHGDIVTAREIEKTNWTSKFHIHKFFDYVIVHKDGIIIKRIIAHDVENGIITCRSLNPDKEKYPDFEIKLSEVTHVMNIVNVSKSRYTSFM